MYKGIAPECNLVAIKVLDRSGQGGSTNVLSGIQWMIDNKEKYNIRIANLSVGTQDIGYRDPLIRAVDAAWDSGIVMCIAAGNNGPASSSVTSPGVSRKVITVGASNDQLAVSIWGNIRENFSGRGPTSECIIKPDVVAPGADVISCLTPTANIGKMQEGKIISRHYLKMSGTSMSTPMVSGAIALLLEKNPELTPDDVKWTLKHTVVDLNTMQNQQGWGQIDISRLLSEEVRYVRKYD